MSKTGVFLYVVDVNFCLWKGGRTNLFSECIGGYGFKAGFLESIRLVRGGWVCYVSTASA